MVVVVAVVVTLCLRCGLDRSSDLIQPREQVETLRGLRKLIGGRPGASLLAYEKGHKDHAIVFSRAWYA